MGWGTLGEVRDGSGYPRESTGQVGGCSGRYKTGRGFCVEVREGRGTLVEVRDWSGVVWGGSGWVVGP